MPELSRKAALAQFKVLSEGVLFGALSLITLTLEHLREASGSDRVGGVKSAAIQRFLATEYRSEVLRAALLLLSLSAIVGAGVGAFATLLQAARAFGTPEATVTSLRRRLHQAGLTFAVLLAVYLTDVAERPALHQTELFELGGIRRAAQILVADGLGEGGILALITLGLGAYLWPLWRRAYLGLKVARNRPTFRKHVWVGSGAVTVLFVCVSGTRAWSHRRSAHTNARPSVILIASDSLRPDYIDEKRAPTLTALRESSTSFDLALTPIARTFPAWVSLSTGQYPYHHGIRHMFPRWETRQKPLETVAGQFARAGYSTAVVGDFAADIFRRIELGYQDIRTPTFTFRELVHEHLFKQSPVLLAFMRGSLMRRLVPSLLEMHEATCPMGVTEDALSAIDDASGAPVFLTVFYSTTHFPYASPGPYHKLFRSKDYDGKYRYAKAVDPTVDEVPTAADIEQIRALYSGAVRATDEAVRELLAGLEARGMRENSLLVVTADHGEQLYEHGRSQGHGDHLVGDESLRVPLFFHELKSHVGRRIPGAVSLVDLAPTILDWAKVPALAHTDGRSLLPALQGGTLPNQAVYAETGLWFTETIADVPMERRLAYPILTTLSEVDRQHGHQVVIKERFEPLTIAAKHRMLDDGTYRLIYQPTREGPVFALYNRQKDPGFTKDRAALEPEVRQGLVSELTRHLDRDEAVERRGEVLWPR